MKALLVGDYHATPTELEECSALAEYILGIVKTEQIPYVIFLGDQYHTHANIHVKVLSFWLRFFQQLSAYTRIITLVGNHDRPGDGSQEHSMISHYDTAVVVEDSMVIDHVGFMAYHPTEADFMETYESMAGFEAIVCHQSFQGSVYENGFKAVDGISIDNVKVPIITGHIHKPQNFRNVWYPGAPRWRSLSDANEQRHLHLVHINDGKVDILKSYPTKTVCKQIRHIKLTEPLETGLPDFNDTSVNWVVDITGSENFIKTMLPELEGKCRIRAYPVVTASATKIKESEGLVVSLGKYLATRPSPTIQTPVLTKEIMNRLNITT